MGNDSYNIVIAIKYEIFLIPTPSTFLFLTCFTLALNYIEHYCLSTIKLGLQPDKTSYICPFLLEFLLTFQVNYVDVSSTFQTGETIEQS